MKLFRSLLIGLVVIVLAVVAVGAFTVNRWVNGPLPQQNGTLTITGLNAPVDVIRDDYGVPHIYAENLHDLFFAQGYVQAQERWWQMEFFRRTGRGEIQELTGRNDSLMGTDIFIRTAGWRRAAENDLAQMPDATRNHLQSFADGVNAYITERPASELAFEYSVLGLTGVDIPVQPWTPLDTVVWTKVMAWDLSQNMSTERFMSALTAEYGAEMAATYLPPYPFDEKPTIVTADDLPPADVSFADHVALFENGIPGSAIELAGGYDGAGFIFGDGEGIGSNNWVVHGNMTESGRPLLADDPHLGIQMPSIWIEVGLHCMPVTDACPLDVRGFTFAPAPGIVVGHNANIAWGVTNVGWDTQDLYRIEINPDNDLQYRWNGEWRDLIVHSEEIRFGDSDETLTVQVREVPDIGPIITDNQYDSDTDELERFVNEEALALKWSAYETGTIIDAIIALNQATDFDEFRQALELWDTPAQNFVYADVEGNIGYQTPGNVPVRANGHSGLMPVDGTTDEFLWRGYVPYEHLPTIFNPERGYIASANEALVPLSYYDQLADKSGEEFGDDANYVFSQTWAYGYRGERIIEMLEATDAHTIESFREIHGDNKMLVAEEIMPYLSALDYGDDTLNDMRDWLTEWDYQMHMDSPQAAFFGHIWMNLMHALYDDQLAVVGEGTPDDPRYRASGNTRNMWATNLLMEQPDNIWWDDIATADDTENRDAILTRVFEEAYNETVEALGDDRSTWRWGDLHQATFVSNPLGVSGIGIIEDTVNYGPVGVSGGDSIVNATGWSASRDSFAVRAVPSMRMIIDLSDYSNNRSIHTTGQSGHPASPHYSDMVETWVNIDYNPMLWFLDDVQASAAATLTLEPAD